MSHLDHNKRLSKILHHLEPKMLNTKSLTRHRCNASNKTLSSVYPSIASQLTSIFGDRYTENDEILLKHGREVIGSARSRPPTAVIYPLSTDEVVQATKLCNTHEPPINLIPYSAGTSLESHILSQNAHNRISITLNFSKMNKIVAIYQDDMQCTVQPGVNWVELNKHLSSYNLFLGVDPAPAACIGGMVATSCSGPYAVRYGTMKNQIINLEVVLSDGTVIKTAQRAIKSVAGYDLNSLFVGSEGTLGIVTQATLRLRAVPKHVEIAQASFDDLDGVGQCVKEVNASGIGLAAFEFMDETMLANCKKYDAKVDLILDKPIILFKFVGASKEHVTADIKLIKAIVAKYTQYPFKWSEDEASRNRLWKVRKMCFWAAKFANPGKECIITDVAVPFSAFNESLVLCKREMDKSWLNTPIVGHIGDGNWHTVLFFDKNKPKDVEEAQRLNDLIVKTAIKLNGTCTAEHGVGKHKVKWLKHELGQNTVDFMKSLKQHIDPNLILNPGNIVAV
eukprot:25670_1